MGDGPGSAAAGRTAVDVFATHAEAGLAASHSGAERNPATLPAAPRWPRGLRAAVAEVQTRCGPPAALSELTGCTLTALLAAPDGDAWLVQLGDSRVYRLRAGLLELLTTDHTMAWLGAVHGWWPAGSAEALAARYRLTRYAGHPDSPEPDVLNVTLRPGDTYLLCTDGLAEQVSQARLTGVLQGTYDPGRAVATLLTDSLTAGGDDNASAVILQVR